MVRNAAALDLARRFAAPSKSYILDLPTRRGSAKQRQHVEHRNIFDALLSTPLRRCYITDRVMPKGFLVSLRRSRSAEGKGIMVPAGILHPRFEEPLPGRAVHFVCWDAAAGKLLDRGMPSGVLYQKLGLTTPSPNVVAQIGHQLCRRAAQEAELFAERFLALPRTLSSGSDTLRPCPIVRLNEEDAIELRRGALPTRLAQLDPLAVVVLHDHLSNAAASSQALPSVQGLVPVLSLGPLFRALCSASTPAEPRSAPAAPATATLLSPESSSADLQGVVTSRLQKVEERYATRHGATRPQDTPYGYAFLRGPDNGVALPFLTALWRARLWTGAGWDGTSATSLDRSRGGGLGILDWTPASPS